MRTQPAGFALAIALALSLFLPGHAVHAAGDAIVIGQSIDLSGPDESIGRDYVAGIKTYFDAINAGGGIHGRRIHYVVKDDRGQPALAAQLGSELIEQEQAEYLIGGVGEAAVRAVTGSNAFRRGSHILFAPLASVGNDNRRVLPWRPNHTREIGHIFDHFGKLGVRHVALAYQASPAHEEAYRSLSAELAKRRMTLSGTARLDAGGAPLAQEAQRLAATRPGMVLVLADTIGTALFLKEYRRHDAQTFVAGTSLINLSTLREVAGAQAMEWTVFSQVVPDPNAGTSLLQVEHLNMMRKYRDEAVSSLTLEGFAAAKALVRAIQQGRTPGRALHEFTARQARIDLGGLSAVAAPDRASLSDYLDIALVRKGSGLRF